MDPGREAMETLTVLGIESSCDETAAAVVSGVSLAVSRRLSAGGDGPGRILSNAVFGQADLHARFGGVVPEIAARAHAERADLVVARALDEAGATFAELDAIAVTAGPGLIGGVLAGVMTGKALAAATGLPLIGVNHLEGHALTPRLTDGIAYPYLLLLVSGGHCQFLAVEGLGRYRRLGGTIDDAPGEAFDKVARALGLGFPGGPEVERAAGSPGTGGNPARFAFPRPLIDRDDCDLSFSGLKTAVVRARDELVAAQGGLWRHDVADLCAAFQAATAEVLASKTARAPCAASRAAHGARSPRRRRRRRRQHPAARGARRGRPGGGLSPCRAAALALHRQRRDDRLGRPRAPRRRARRRSSHRPPPLASRSDRRPDARRRQARRESVKGARLTSAPVTSAPARGGRLRSRLRGGDRRVDTTPGPPPAAGPSAAA